MISSKFILRTFSIAALLTFAASEAQTKNLKGNFIFKGKVEELAGDKRGVFKFSGSKLQLIPAGEGGGFSPTTIILQKKIKTNGNSKLKETKTKSAMLDDPPTVEGSPMTFDPIQYSGSVKITKPKFEKDGKTLKSAIITIELVVISSDPMISMGASSPTVTYRGEITRETKKKKIKRLIFGP